MENIFAKTDENCVDLGKILVYRLIDGIQIYMYAGYG